MQGRPSLARSEQFWADAFNVLCCSAYLALSACLDADELIGSRTSKLSVAMRDIHAKCSELLVCLLLRGTPLRVLYQVSKFFLITPKNFDLCVFTVKIKVVLGKISLDKDPSNKISPFKYNPVVRNFLRKINIIRLVPTASPPSPYKFF